GGDAGRSARAAVRRTVLATAVAGARRTRARDRSGRAGWGRGAGPALDGRCGQADGGDGRRNRRRTELGRRRALVVNSLAGALVQPSTCSAPRSQARSMLTRPAVHSLRSSLAGSLYAHSP